MKRKGIRKNARFISMDRRDPARMHYDRLCGQNVEPLERKQRHGNQNRKPAADLVRDDARLP